ncbi:hypothetical protein ACFQ1I_16495 [Kitasatospora arboriphila]
MLITGIVVCRLLPPGPVPHAAEILLAYGLLAAACLQALRGRPAALAGAAMVLSAAAALSLSFPAYHFVVLAHLHNLVPLVFLWEWSRRLPRGRAVFLAVQCGWVLAVRRCCCSGRWTGCWPRPTGEWRGWRPRTRRRPGCTPRRGCASWRCSPSCRPCTTWCGCGSCRGTRRTPRRPSSGGCRCCEAAGPGCSAPARGGARRALRHRLGAGQDAVRGGGELPRLPGVPRPVAAGGGARPGGAVRPKGPLVNATAVLLADIAPEPADSAGPLVIVVVGALVVAGVLALLWFARSRRRG